jgi:hypothetical protein
MFRLTIETENAAFGESMETVVDEVTGILREVAGRIDRGVVGGPIRDTNGNSVGTYTLTFDEEGE